LGSSAPKKRQIGGNTPTDLVASTVTDTGKELSAAAAAIAAGRQAVKKSAATVLMAFLSPVAALKKR
jgi:hypothetical protein